MVREAVAGLAHLSAREKGQALVLEELRDTYGGVCGLPLLVSDLSLFDRRLSSTEASRAVRHLVEVGTLATFEPSDGRTWVAVPMVAWGAPSVGRRVFVARPQYDYNRCEWGHPVGKVMAHHVPGFRYAALVDFGQGILRSYRRGELRVCE